MDHWITMLREQAAQITGGDYVPGTPAFTRAPAGLVELSRDLDNLALAIADRVRVQQATIRDVQHRVMNNLQIVTSLLRMQANNVRDTAVSEALQHTQARIGALALIHRMLYDQTDECSHGSLDLARLMSELCEHMRLWNRDRTDVEFICEASSVAVPLDSAMPLALFAVEAVSNAYSHAFPEGRRGNVTLNYSVSGNGAAMLSVVDDGIGFETASANTSLGFQLMHGCAHQLGGTVNVISVIGSGTEVRLEYGASD